MTRLLAAAAVASLLLILAGLRQLAWAFQETGEWRD